MNLRILTVGKIKEQYLADAISEYSKRLSRYASLEIIEVRDEKNDENASEKENEKVKELEGERLLSKIGERDYVVCLAIKGKTFSSEEMSEALSRIMNTSGTVDFIIGGSLGLSETVLRRADESWSFSRLTFPHQLMRVILLEQLYRSFRIMKNEPYHK